MARVRIERKTDWSLHPAASHDKEKIVNFYSMTTWKEKAARDLYEWKFGRNPQGETLVMTGRNTDSNVIAAGAFMPWTFYHDSNAIGASQWVDMIIELAYRGQDIPAKVLGTARDIFRQRGAHICFAFPNENGVLVHKENKGFYLGSIVRYAKPLNTQYLMNRFIKHPKISRLLSIIVNAGLRLLSRETFYTNLSGMTFTQIDRSECDAKFDEFWAKASKMYSKKIMTRRDRAYLLWKFVDAPNSSRQLYALKGRDGICSYVILEISGSTGYIVDILALDDRSRDMIIANALKIFREDGLDSAVFVALEKNMYRDAFASFGFVERPDKKHFYVYVDDGTVDKGYFLNPANWYITIGDCDIEKL